MKLFHRDLLSVGVTGFEPATAWSQTRSATGLRYAPNGFCALSLMNWRAMADSKGTAKVVSFLNIRNTRPDFCIILSFWLHLPKIF